MNSSASTSPDTPKAQPPSQRELVLSQLSWEAEMGNLELDAADRTILLTKPASEWTPKMRAALQAVNDSLPADMKVM